jgi:tetratricopeptide (TPR) repeat protein
MRQFKIIFALSLVIASPRRGRGDPAGLLRRFAPRNDRLRLLFLLSLLPVFAFAQVVRWDPPGGQLGFNQVSELSLVFENCEPELDKLRMPPVVVDGLSFVGQPSQNSETSMVNFKTTHRYSLVFPVRPVKRTTITIPEFTVQTDKGALPVKAASYTVGDATVGGSGLALADIATAKLTLPKNNYWAGEVFPINYTLSVVERNFHSPGSVVEWSAAPLVIEDWSKLEGSKIQQQGERRVVITQNTRGYAKQPGNYTLKPATQMANLVVGQTGFGLFSSPAVEQRALSSEPVEIAIRALPSAPPSFSGTVGEFSLVSKVVPTAPAVGEPVTWTIELTGTGNWPDISGLPQRDVSNDFQVVQPKSKRTMKDNALFEGTLAEDVVLVPTKPGSYTLGPVKFTYFNTATGSYQTITTETVTVNVSAVSTTPLPHNVQGAPVQFSLAPLPSSQSTGPKLPTAVPPVPPENLPRDPLAESQHGSVPFYQNGLWLAATVPAATVVLLAWLTLAALRSRALDPQRHRRAAKIKLAATLAELRSSGTKPPRLHAQLRQWQLHTATLWEIPHAAPGAPLVRAAVATHARDSAAAWTTLWNEADRTQHGPATQLPTDWTARAEAALHAVKIPDWNPFALFSGKHLIPSDEKAEGLNSIVRVTLWLVVFFSLSALQPSAFGADTAIESYKKGDFPAAEKSWQAAIKTAPNDWTARHNLGLALSQQDRWPEATAHWTSAFLLAPAAPETRWALALGLQRSGLAPQELVEFSQGKGRHALARHYGPGAWQQILIGVSFLIGAALVLLLLKSYGHIGDWAKPAALTSILLAILTAAAASFSLRTYGPLAHPDAVLVWQTSVLRSIPTEADTAQKTTPLSAGSIAIADKTFLTSWTHLTFPGGQSGWVRSDALIRLYR